MRSAKIKKLIKRFENAVNDYAFLGASHPEDHEGIINEYKASKKALYAAITELENDAQLGLSAAKAMY